jgi:tetratricopeptide (TPR) repeat protein
MSINFRCCELAIALSVIISSVTSAMSLEPDYNSDPKFYINRGKDFVKAGKIDHAIIDFQAAINLDPWTISARTSLGGVMLNDGDYQRALNEFNIALRQVEDDLQHRRKENDPDLAQAERAASSWKSLIYGSRSAAYYGLKKYDLAVQDCERAIRFNPSSAVSYNNCGGSNRELSNFERALQYYSKALEIKPDLEAAWAGRGRTYVRMSRYVDAIRDCKMAVQLNSRSAGGMLCLGEAYKAQGIIPDAIRNYKALLAISPFSQTAREALAELTHNSILKEKRVALVIGNGAYKNSPLDSSVNDANDVAEALTKLGFAVIKGVDVNILAMGVMFERFSRRAKDADVALVYFSGHGAQYKGANYLVPIENNLQWTGGAAVGFEEYINLQENVDVLKNVGRIRILIVDACRTTGELARIEERYGPDVTPLDPAGGMFIAYASAPDSYSYDGGRRSRNSPFTRSLLRHLTVKGLELREMFTSVRNEAYDYSGRKQISQTWDNMPREFRFYPSNAQLIEP